MTGATDHAYEPGETVACRNCAATLHGPYCAHCGQHTDTHRRSIADLIGDLLSDIASFDSRLLRTGRALLFQPGELPLAFHQGRIQRYVPAIRLYFFVTLVFFLVLGATGLAILQLEIVGLPTKVIWDSKGNAFIRNPAYDVSDPDTASLPKLLPITRERALEKGGPLVYGLEPFFFARLGSVHSAVSDVARRDLEPPQMDQAPRNARMNWVRSRIAQGTAALAKDPAAINTALTTWIPRALLLLVPLYAAMLALVQWRRRKNYFFVDHVIFSLNIHTFLFVALLIAAGLAQLLPGDWIAYLLLLTMTAYIYLAMKRFYGQGWVKTGVKFVIVSGLYCVFCIVPALIGIAALAFFGGSLG
jgi:hypothetical protein